MPAILPTVKFEDSETLARILMPHQVNWCMAEDHLHAQGRAAYALAEKSVRIGFTFADAVKNVRKRLRFKCRDYLFATRDYPSALEYMRVVLEVADLFDYTRAIVFHGEEYLKVQRLTRQGRPSGFTEEIKVGTIKFDNKSRILAFSSSPQAMAVHAGDVGLDEFAKHPNSALLWETAQGRITWGYDVGIWSAHDGEDTLFNQFAQEARAGRGPWNLYYHVTVEDAIDLGLLEKINTLRGTHLTREVFLADCKARARDDAIFQQAYMCTPMGATSAAIVDWSAIERCRSDYKIERLHLEASQVSDLFGAAGPSLGSRTIEIAAYLRQRFPILFGPPSGTRPRLRLGFDVAASGKGDLACIYIDEAKGDELWLRALFTCRTEDWHFLTTVLNTFLRDLPYIQAAGDESGLGRQVCWTAAQAFPSRFTPVNFSGKKHDLGFALMNQLSVAHKHFPSPHQDIAADYYALRKSFVGQRWIFSQARNEFNPLSHCDIAWAGALATHAHTCRKNTLTCRVG